MQHLAKGANASIPATAVTVTLTWSDGPGVPDVDVSALLCGPSRAVSSDADFVFYNQVTHPSGAVQHAGKVRSGGAARDAVQVHLAALPAAVETVVVAASSDSGTFGQVPGLAVTVTDGSTGQALVRFDMDAGQETAFIAGELYRRGGAWKFRAVGQGYTDGIAGLARDFGITVDDPGPTPLPAPPLPVPVPTPLPAVPPAPAPQPSGGIDWLNPPVPSGYES